MSDKWQISVENRQAAMFHLLKELWSQNMVMASMLNELVAKLNNTDPQSTWPKYEADYNKRIQQINDVIIAEFGHLDLADILGEKPVKSATGE